MQPNKIGGYTKMKLSIQGIWKHKKSTLVGLLLWGRVVYKFYVGELSFDEFVMSIHTLEATVDTILGGISFLVEKPANLNNRKKSI